MERCKKIVWILVIILSMLVIGCKKSGENKKTSLTPTPAVIEDPPEVKVYPTAYQTSNTITWLLPFYSELTEQNRNEINRILYENGLDCQISFVKTTPLNGRNFETWLEEYEKHTPLDVINSGSWTLGDAEQSSFVEKRMVQLNEYLKTDNAEVLKETYTEEEWKSVAVDGNIYVIPEAVYQIDDKIYRVETGVYVAVNESYLDFFENFDGTYASLRQIYNDIGDSELRIVTDGMPAGSSLYALMGYSALFYDQLPFCEDTENVINMLEGEKVKNTLKQIYEDMLSGTLLNRQLSGDTEEKILAYIYMNGENKDGFREYKILSNLYDFNCAGKYGISVNSTQKELALQILTVCLSNPEILAQLYPGADVQTIARRTELIDGEGDMRMAGIRLELSEDQLAVLRDFQNDYYVMLGGMILQKENGEMELNPEFDIEKAWNDFSDSRKKDYAEVCETANQQITAFLKNRENP